MTFNLSIAYFPVPSMFNWAASRARIDISSIFSEHILLNNVLTCESLEGTHLLEHLSNNLSVCPSVCLSVYLSIQISIYIITDPQIQSHNSYSLYNSH
jgi:hypothetical protein